MPPEALRPATPSWLSDRSASAGESQLLQQRLALLGLISVGLCTAFYLAGQAMVIAGREAAWPLAGHAVLATATLLAAGLWLFCRRGSRASSILRALEATVTILAAPVVMAMATFLIPEPALRAMVMLLGISLTLYARSIFIPSSARRTLVVSVLAAMPVAAYSLVTEPARLSGWKLMWLGAAIAVATAGSAGPRTASSITRWSISKASTWTSSSRGRAPCPRAAWSTSWSRCSGRSPRRTPSA